MFVKEKANQYVNLYNLALLFIGGYKVDSFVTLCAKPIIVLRQDQAHKIGGLGTILINLTAPMTSESVALLAENSLNCVSAFVKSDKCPYNQKTKDTLLDLTNFESNAKEQIVSGAYTFELTRYFNKINASKDLVYGMTTLSGITSLSCAADKYAKEINDVHNRAEYTHEWELVSKTLSDIFAGNELTNVQSQNTMEQIKK